MHHLITNSDIAYRWLEFLLPVVTAGTAWIKAHKNSHKIERLEQATICSHCGKICLDELKQKGE